MYQLILKNKIQTFGEILTDVDYGSFKYEYEKNNERSISFTIIKTTSNQDIFDNIANEAYIEWLGQIYVIKSTSLKYDGTAIVNEIVAKHIFLEFQDWYIDKDLQSEEMNSETTDDESKPTYTLQQYLDFGFRNNNLGYSYEIIGKFDKRVAIDELGNKNGIEFLSEGAELFSYIYFADNKKIKIYDEASFYEMSDEPFIYKYNMDDVQVTTSTLDIRTYIEGYGKKKTKAETKNYSPIKPKDLTYTGTFIKDGTWRTETIGAAYSKEFECKWGNETLTWTLKKMSKGGLLDVYLDNKLIGTYDCYSNTATSEQIVIAKNLLKGKHTFKAVFKQKKDNVDYKKSNPCMYVGTEKSTVLNLTAVLKGTDLYYAYADYKSPNYEVFGAKKAPTLFDDNALDTSDLKEKLRLQLNDQPTVDLSTNYLGSMEDKKYLTLGRVKENSKVRFIHKSMGFNTDLKVVKLTVSHPYIYEPVQVDFSNSPHDIIKIQQNISRNIKRVNNLIRGGSLKSGTSISMPQLASDSIGSVIIDG